jgi:hypothetical protein
MGNADPGGLEHGELPVPGAQVGAAGLPGRDAGGVGRVDHVGRLRGRGHPQADPEVEVGPHVGADHAPGALGGEHDVDPEAAPPHADAHHARHELGQLLDQRGELVHHDHEARQPLAGAGPVVLDVLGAGVGEEVLAAAQLGRERVERAVDQVPVEVGDQPDAVRQVGAGGERAAALVVDQHEREPVRPVPQCQRRDQGLQQLRLAGPGGTGDQRVRAVAAEIDPYRSIGPDP